MPSAGLPEEVTVRPQITIILTDSMRSLQKVKNGMGSPDWNVSMVNIHLRNLLQVYCPGHAGVKGNDRADSLAEKSNHHRGLASRNILNVEELETLLAGHKSQGYHTIDRLEERSVQRGSARRSSLKGRERAIVNQANIVLELFQMRRWGNF